MQLLSSLDALDHGLDPQALAELDDAASNSNIVGCIFAQGGDDAPVDVHFVDRELPQVR